MIQNPELKGTSFNSIAPKMAGTQESTDVCLKIQISRPVSEYSNSVDLKQNPGKSMFNNSILQMIL